MPNICDLYKDTLGKAIKEHIDSRSESFDISGKVDTENPIFKFYEKEVGKYLKNKYGATQITDAQGVKWWEIDLKGKGFDKAPVEAYGLGAGIEPETDEEGNVTGVGFNPAMAVLGIAGMGVAKNLAKGAKIEQRLAQEISGADDVEQLAREVATRTRGTISDKTALETARSLGFTEDYVMNLPVGKALNKEQKVAVSGLTQNAIEELRALEKSLPEARLKPDLDDNRRILEQYALQKVKVMKMLAVERGVAAESGRALQAHKALAQSIQEEEKRIARFLADPKVNPQKKDFVIDQIARHGADPEKMKDLLRKLQDPTLMEMAAEFATAVKLYAIPTHLVNILTATARLTTNIPLRGLSASIDALEGARRQRFFSEVANEATGQYMGWKSSWKDSLKALQDENYAMEARKFRDFEPKGAAIRGRLGKDELVDKALDVFGKGIRMSFRMLGVEDALLRRPAELGEMYTLAGRSANQRGMKTGSKAYNEYVADFVLNPSAEALKKAETAADRALFQDELGGIMKKVNSLRSQFPASKLIVPFYKTIVNLIKQAIEFSPMAPILPSVREGLKTRGTRADVLAKMALGSSALIPLTMHAMEDKITLAAPQNPAERDAFYAEGKQPYSVRLGDTWYPYSRFSPFSEWFVNAGLIAQAIKNEDEKSVVELARDGFFSLSANVLDKSFVSGISDLLDALTDPDRADTWAQNFITGATLPTILGSGARALDPTIREVESIKDAYYARLPGLSQELPARLDAFGEELQRPGDALTRFISPVVPSKVKVDVVRDELKTLGMDIGFPSKEAFGENLNDEQYRSLLRASGQIIYNVLSEVVISPEYQELPAGEREDLVQGIVNRVRTRVRESAFPELQLVRDLRVRLQDRGMSEEEARKAANEIYEEMKLEQSTGQNLTNTL